MPLSEPGLQPTGATSTSGDHTGAPSITAPEINAEEAKRIHSTRRAINSIDQIYSICEAMFNPSSDRNKKNAVIADQANDCQPFPADELKQKGQKFRHNHSTGVFSGRLSQAVGAPVRMINQAKSLTSASLKPERDPQGTKTEGYRRKFTKVVRSWEDWDNHITNIAWETVTFGYAAAVCDDFDDWRPEECRQDNFGVHDNTGQHPNRCQFFGRRKSFLIHKLIEKIADATAADAAGWNIPNCIAALNESMPEDRSEQGSTTSGSGRNFVDLVRDGNAGAAYDPKARTVDVYILLATEHDGKVSKYMVTQKDHRILYECEDEFEKLSDITSFYSLEPGAGTLYSSKGLGRRAVNTAKSQERGRMKSMDATYLGGLVWFKTPKGMVGVQLKVFDQFGIFGTEAELQPEAFPVNFEAWDRFDERCSAFLDQSIGSYTPSKEPAPGTKGDKRTAHEVMVDAQREAQEKSEWLERFFTQFGDEMGIVAKRLGNPDTKDEAAKKFQQELAEEFQISPEDLKELIDQPQGLVIQDLTQEVTQALMQDAPLLLQSPFFDKYKLTRELAVRRYGEELTNRLMFPNGIDPNDEAKQIRQQIQEIAAIKTGESVNVVQDDNHKVHSSHIVRDLKRGEPKMMSDAQAGALPPSKMDDWQTLIKHWDAHLAEWEKQAPQDPQEQKLLQTHKAAAEDSQQKHDATLVAMKQRQEQQGGQQPTQPQPGGPGAPQGQPSQQPQQAGGKVPERMYGPMTETLLKAWIGKFELLSAEMRAQLEKLSGLMPDTPNSNGAATSALTSQSDRPTPEAVSQPQIIPP